MTVKDFVKKAILVDEQKIAVYSCMDANLLVSIDADAHVRKEYGNEWKPIYKMKVEAFTASPYGIRIFV